MTKSFLFTTALALGLALPAVAAAQTAPAAGASGEGRASCPPGSWFCADPPQQPPPSTGQALQPLPDPDASTAPPPREGAPTVTYQPAPPPPPIVVYEPPSPSMLVRPEAPPPYEYAPRRAPISRPREWGLNLHLEGATIGSGTHGNTGMGGAGAGLRYKPVRAFGLEADVDFTGGRDYQGEKRSETAFTLNGLVFLNPRSHAQIYLLAGFGWSAASVDGVNGSSTPVHYGYFGAQAGVGLELRLGRSIALNGDFRGFVRSRTDDLAQSQPEFTDANGRTTNTSGGGLLTGGMTLYF